MNEIQKEILEEVRQIARQTLASYSVDIYLFGSAAKKRQPVSQTLISASIPKLLFLRVP